LARPGRPAEKHVGGDVTFPFKMCGALPSLRYLDGYVTTDPRRNLAAYLAGRERGDTEARWNALVA
jgi:hypothetical protein